MKKNKKQNKKILGIKRVFINILIVISIIYTYNFFVTKSEGAKHIETREFTVCPQDTLWNIAKDTCKNTDMNIEECMIEIKKINNLNTSSLYIGQTINLPIY